MNSRTLAGIGIFALSCGVFLAIFIKPDLAKDDLFKMLAQAVVVQGLVGLAMAYWFTAQHRETASGKPDDPMNVKEAPPDSEPPG